MKLSDLSIVVGVLTYLDSKNESIREKRRLEKELQDRVDWANGVDRTELEFYIHVYFIEDAGEKDLVVELSRLPMGESLQSIKRYGRQKAIEEFENTIEEYSREWKGIITRNRI